MSTTLFVLSAAILGIGEYRGDTVPVEPTFDAAPRASAADDPTVLFLNFDGATLVAGADDSRGNVTTIGTLEGEFSSYGEGSKRDAVIQAVRDDWAVYNVVIADDRPDSGDYVMCMVGPSDAYPSSTLGIAPLDCGDRTTRNNITFAFHSEDDAHSASATATTISQEIAHSFGLEHVSDPSDIMNPYNVGGDPSFTDSCLPIVGEPECGDQHVEACGSSSMQNAHAELLEYIGGSGPDTSGPGIEMAAPEDGERFEIREPFEIVIIPDDELEVAQMDLFVNGSWTDSDEDAPFGWTATDVGEGWYELRVEAQEFSGRRVSTETIMIQVGDPPTSELEDPQLPPQWGFGRMEAEGCACSTGDTPSGWQGALVLLFILGGVSRPRRRGCVGRMRG